MRPGRRPYHHLLLLRWERIGQKPRQISKDHHGRHNVLVQVLVLGFVGPDLVPYAFDVGNRVQCLFSRTPFSGCVLLRFSTKSTISFTDPNTIIQASGHIS
jgi:hypothetical protein